MVTEQGKERAADYLCLDADIRDSKAQRIELLLDGASLRLAGLPHRYSWSEAA